MKERETVLMTRNRCILTSCICGAMLVPIAALLSVESERPFPVSEYSLWDGKESVVDYAKRVGLAPTRSVQLAPNLKLEFVLIPAGSSGDSHRLCTFLLCLSGRRMVRDRFRS